MKTSQPTPPTAATLHELYSSFRTGIGYAFSTGVFEDTDTEALMAYAIDQRDGRPVTFGLTLSPGVVALDVHGQRGANTLAALEARLGPLPATFRNTRRRKGSPSGQRLYLAPLPGERRQLGVGVSIEGRLPACWPSAVDGNAYRWLAPCGHWLPRGIVPTRLAVAVLPPAWVEYLTQS